MRVEHLWQKKNNRQKEIDTPKKKKDNETKTAAAETDSEYHAIPLSTGATGHPVQVQ